MTITISDLQREAKIASLKVQIVNLSASRDSVQAQLRAKLDELAELLGKEVVGECLIDKASS